MRPKYLKQRSIDSLLVNFAEAKPHYMKGDKDWFRARFDSELGLRNTVFDFPDVSLTCGDNTGTGEEYAETDRENARRLYGAMKSLPLATAIDQRFWAGLAHTICWDFVQYRRRNEIASGDDKAIKASYFFMWGAKRSAHVNCLSRLWWAGKFSYDERNAHDPFELTDLITEKAFASRILLFSSNNFMANPSIALGILDAIKEQKDSDIPLRREHFVGPSKYLNRMGAMTIVDYLSREQIRELVREYFSSNEFAQLKV